MTTRFFRLLPFIWLVSALFSQTLSAQDHTAEIDALFEDLNKDDAPGAAIAIMQKGKVLYRKGFGAANLEYNLPITPKTVFHAASLSKQFTAFSILQLADAGEISLKDDVRKHVPELKDYGEVVTIQHMLTHTSGLRDQWRLLALAGWAREDVVRNQEILDLAARQRGLNFTPGDRFMYSNLGYTLLAEIVARVSGQSFAEYTMKNIFEPLGMNNSQFYDNYHKIVKNRAYSYGKVKGELVKRPLNFSTVGATSLFTTVEDLLLWAQNFSTMQIGNTGIMEKMKEGAVLNSGKELGVLAGQFRGTYLGHTLYLHSGSDAGFRSYLLRFPEEEISVALLANVSSVDAETMAISAAHYYLSQPEGKVEDAGSTGEKENFPHQEDIFISLSDLQLKTFVGKYWEHNNWYDREIRMTEEGLIYYRPESGKSTKIRPVGAAEFKMIDDTEDVTIRFSKGKNGLQSMSVQVNENPEIEHLAYSEVALGEYFGTYYSDELVVTYTITEKDGKLILYHLRKGEIVLTPVTQDYFTCRDRNYKKVQFLRNETGEISGLSISNGGITRMDFQRKKATRAER